MKSIICTIHKKIWLVLVCALVKVMPQLVMNGDEIFIADLDAHLDANIILVVDVPCGRMTNNVPISRFIEQRALPKRWWQRIESQRLVKILSVLDHPTRIQIFRAQQFR